MATKSLLAELALSKWPNCITFLALTFSFCSTAPRPPKGREYFAPYTVGLKLRTTASVYSSELALPGALQKLLRATPANAVYLSRPLLDWVRDQVHVQSKQAHSKNTGDLDISQAADFVSFQTVKMRKRMNRRSGGWLVACDGRGMIIGAREFYAGESLTQRAALVAHIIDQFDSVSTIIHDDSCHLQRFMDKWMCDHPRLTYPSTRYVLDGFHSKSHKDSWCRQNCFPNTLENKDLVSNVNTSNC